MKKLVINLFLVLTIFIIYFLQSNFFNWFNIAGIMPNVFVIFVLFIGLFTNKTVGTIYGVVIGLILDLLFSQKIGIQAVSFGLVGFLAAIFDKNFSKDSRITILLMGTICTVLYEVALYILRNIIIGIDAEVIEFLRILLIEVIYNILLLIILYPIMKFTGYEIENEIKGDKILTRYF